MTAITLTLLLIQLVAAEKPAENAAEATGWLNTIWADWGDGRSAQFFYLVEADGRRTRILVDGNLLRDSRIEPEVPCAVRVRGSWQEDSRGRVLTATELQVAHLSAGESPSAAVVGPQPWLVILCRFSDVAEEPKSLSDYQGLLSSSYPGLDHFWREVSYNQINLTGSRVIGWYKLPSPRSRYLYGALPFFDTAVSLADAVRLADPHVNFASYKGIALVFNDFLGPETMGYGGPVRMTLDGVTRNWGVTWMPTSIFHGVYDHQFETTHHSFAHEMGHAFGLPHSSSPYGETYDNYWDLMSHWDARVELPGFGRQAQHTISYHKDLLGWIGSGKRLIESGSQSTVELEHLSLPRSSRLKMIEVPIAGSTRFYTAESRSRDGYDNALFAKAIILHEVEPGRYQTNVVTGGPERRPAHVIDADANGYTNDEGVMWTPGEMFRDKANGISISIEEETPQGFVLTVNHNLHLLPQYVAGGGIASTLILSNPSVKKSVSGSIRLIQRDGKPSTVKVNGMPYVGAVDFAINPGGRASFQTESTGELSVGWAKVSGDSPFDASLVYAGSAGVAGIASSTLSTRSLLTPVETDSLRGVRSGLAVSNPQASQAQVNLQLRDVDGSKVPGGDRLLTLGAGEQVALFADEIFPAVDLAQFRGTVDVSSSLPIDGVAIWTRPNQFASLPVQPADPTVRLRQTGVVTTLAGTAGASGLVNGNALESRFSYPQGLARDQRGNIYVADTANHSIRKISADGVVSTFAGNGTGGSADGAGQEAGFLNPRGLCLDKAGNLWVADTDNHTIRKITPDGTVTTVAGKAGEAGAADGPGPEARFRGPRGLVSNDSGEIYVADRANNTIRRITPDGHVTTVAGLVGEAGFADGTGAAARFDRPAKLALASNGDLYVTDLNNCVIRRVTPLGAVTTFAGAPGVHGVKDGPALESFFNNPRGISADASGAYYVCDGWTIRKISSDGFVTTLAGNMKIVTAPGMTHGGSADGTGTEARFAVPWDLIAAPGGILYVADTNNHTLRKIAVADVSEKVYFPQFGYGEGLSSCLIVLNRSTSQNCTGVVEFFDTLGAPMEVGINGTPEKHTFEFNLPPKGLTFLMTGGMGDLRIGSAAVTSSLPVSATVLFSSPWGLTGVPAVQPLSRFSIPVDIAIADRTNTGLALSNPVDSPVQVTVRLKDETGALVAGANSQFEIQGNGQWARFPAEVFQAMPVLESFRGTFVVESSQPICGLGVLVTGNEAAALPSVAIR